MNKKVLGVSVISILVIVIAVVIIKSKNSEPVDTKMAKVSAIMEKQKMSAEDTEKNNDSMTKEDSALEKNDSSMEEKHGYYKDYSPETINTEQQSGQKIVLFFHAVWCPYCKAADAEFKAHANKIPAGVTVLKTDYDGQTELKKKYGVTYQHTFVQIDNNSNLITKWVSGDVALLTQNIK